MDGLFWRHMGREEGGKKGGEKGEKLGGGDLGAWSAFAQ